MAKKKKKNKVDTRLFIIRNTKKTLKYYFKNILYILFMNFIVFLIYDKIFKNEFMLFVSRFLLIGSMPFYFCTIILPLVAFYTIKVILYTNAIYIVRNGGINDIGDLFSTVTERFLPVFGTFLLYIASILFFSLFLVLPGIATIFYFFFAVYLSALGDLNDGKKFINGGKALARSFQLVKKNLIRFSSTITLLAISAFIIEKTLLFIVKASGIPVDISISKAVLFTALDVIVICGALLINKFESIESEYLAETIK